MNLDNFVIRTSASLREALTSIEANGHGVVFLSQSDGSISAIATDGDIRRWLLDGGSLEDPVEKCSNQNFVWDNPGSPREVTLKKLDHRIRVIPILDQYKNLVGIISRDNLPIQRERKVYARAKAPVRISFSGGGSDLTRYFAGEGGAVINTTISLFSHATLRKRDDDHIFIRSLDLGDEFFAETLADAISKESQFGLVQALLKAINPNFGFELLLHSDFPIGSGLGGSAALAASILGCFNQFRHDQWNAYELAEIAYQAERHYFNIAGGWQDQYATIFGGFNFMEFRMDQNIVHPLRLPTDTSLELEQCFVLCSTGTSHDSNDIHTDQIQNINENNVRKMMRASVELSYQMRNDLLRGRLNAFGHALDKAWDLKRQFSKKISSHHFDKIYQDAKANGAIGGKLLGAGGGGFFLFYVPANDKHQLMSHLSSSGLKVQPFRFEPTGLQAWIVREDAVQNEK